MGYYEEAEIRALEKRTMTAEAEVARLRAVLADAVDVMDQCANLIGHACPDASVWTDGLGATMDSVMASMRAVLDEEGKS